MAPATDSHSPSAAEPKALALDDCPNCGRGHATRSCPPQDLLEGIADVLDELHRLADAAEGIADDVRKTRETIRDGLESLERSLFYALTGFGTTEDLARWVQENTSIGSDFPRFGLPVLLKKVTGLGLAPTAPPDLDGVERALGDLASAVEALPNRIEEARALARRRAPRRRAAPPVAPSPGKPRSFADREARRHAGEGGHD